MKKIITSIAILFLFIALAFLVSIAILIASGNASTTYPRVPERPIAEDLSQIAVIHGFVLDVKLLGTQEDIYTNVRIRMYGVPQDVSILFCGYQGDSISFGPMELRFQTAAPKKYQGIGCFTLISVKRWEDPRGN